MFSLRRDVKEKIDLVTDKNLEEVIFPQMN